MHRFLDIASWKGVCRKFWGAQKCKALTQRPLSFKMSTTVEVSQTVEISKTVKMSKSAPLQYRPPNLLQRTVKRIASLRLIAWLLARTLRHLDRGVMRISGGRTTATSLLTGLPVIHLTTIGAKSGQPRTTPLICGVDGDRLILFATNFGGEKNPAWSYNLRANPVATVSYRGRATRYRSREATPEERTRYWPMADQIYPGYAAYRKRAAHRDIPVFVLERSEE